MLSNRTYLGEVAYKGSVYPGEHDAIVPVELWDDVQRLLANNRVERKHQTRAAEPSPLAGMIRDGEGRRMTPSHACKAGIRYRYYVSVDEDAGPRPRPIRVAAHEIEQAIVASLTVLLGNRELLFTTYEEQADSATAAEALLGRAAELRDAIDTMTGSQLRELLLAVDLRVIVHADRIEAGIATEGLGRQLGVEAPTSRDADRLDLVVRTIVVRRGTQLRLTIIPDGVAAPGKRDPKLMDLLIRAYSVRRRLGLDGQAGDEAALVPGKDRDELSRVARLSFLAPDIVSAILDGRQPVEMTARRLLRLSSLPAAWPEQRRMLGFG